MAFHVACGEGGMATNLDQFGPALQLPWTRLKAPELTQELRNKMVNGCKDMSKGKHFLEMAKDRDNAIAAILSAIKTITQIINEVNMNFEVIVTCAVTGAGETVDKSPHVPVTPKEVADALSRLRKLVRLQTYSCSRSRNWQRIPRYKLI